MHVIETEVPGLLNHSRSARKSLRGLHLQVRTPQGKLVRGPSLVSRRREA